MVVHSEGTVARNNVIYAQNNVRSVRSVHDTENLLALGCVLFFQRVCMHGGYVFNMYLCVCAEAGSLLNSGLCRSDKVEITLCVHFPLGGAEGPEKCQAGL